MTNKSECRPPARTAEKWVNEPPPSRNIRLQAWQHHRSCRNCRYWGDIYDREDDDDPAIRQCNSPSVERARMEFGGFAFITPEDHTCEEFEVMQ